MAEASNITLKDLTIKNLSVPNRTYGQAVALHVIGDNFKAINCNVLGAQDTILAGPIPYDLTIRYKNLLSSDELTQINHTNYMTIVISRVMLILFSDVVFAFSMNVKYILSEKDIFVLLLTLKIIIMVLFFISAI